MSRKKNLDAFKKGVSTERSRAKLIVAAAGIFALLLIAFYLLRTDKVIEKEGPVALPKFSAIPDIGERKKAFFEFLIPFIESSNEKVLELRAEVEKLQGAFEKNGSLNEKQLQRLREIEIQYEFNPDDGINAQTFRDVMARVDIIPPSLALAQAALESAWGTSRFAQQGNNLYGIWCYEPGCGLIPRRRPPGRTYEVQRFDSPRQCFDAYIHNLNTNSHYGSMRAIRRALRRNGSEIRGYDLAEGLSRYSEEGFTYVSKVQSLIGANNLGEYDR